MDVHNEVRPRLVLRGLQEEVQSIFSDASTWQRRLRDANFSGPDSRQGAKVVSDLIDSALLVQDPKGDWNCWRRSSRVRFDPIGTLKADGERALGDPSFADSLRLYQSLRQTPKSAFLVWRRELLDNPGIGDISQEAGRIAVLLSILEAALKPNDALDYALGIDFRTVEGLKDDPALARLGFLQQKLRQEKRDWDDTKKYLQGALVRQGVRWPTNVSSEQRYPFSRELESFRFTNSSGRR